MSEEVSAEVSEPEPDQSTEPRGIRRFALRHPRLMVWLIAVLIFGMWGSWAGPGWNPQPMRSLIVPESADTSIATRNETPGLGDYEVQSEVITVELRDGTEIPATLRTPVGTDGLAPGMVFVHGTGTDSYQNFDREADAITSAGVITLVPDKRTDNYTTTHRDYPELSKDYEDAFTDLLSRPGVDPQRTGLYAVSEGCNIAPIVAARNSAVSYVALVSAPVLPIREQGAFAADSYLRNLGAPEQILVRDTEADRSEFWAGCVRIHRFRCLRIPAADDDAGVDALRHRRHVHAHGTGPNHHARRLGNRGKF